MEAVINAQSGSSSLFDDRSSDHTSHLTKHSDDRVEPEGDTCLLPNRRFGESGVDNDRTNLCSIALAGDEAERVTGRRRFTYPKAYVLLSIDDFRIMRKVLPVRAKWDRAKKKDPAIGARTCNDP